jgi:hypothetical protein
MVHGNMSACAVRIAHLIVQRAENGAVTGQSYASPEPRLCTEANMFLDVSLRMHPASVDSPPAVRVCSIDLARIALRGLVTLLATACQSDPPHLLASSAAGVPIGDPPRSRIEQVDRLVEVCYDPFTFDIP